MKHNEVYAMISGHFLTEALPDDWNLWTEKEVQSFMFGRVPEEYLYFEHDELREKFERMTQDILGMGSSRQKEELPRHTDDEYTFIKDGISTHFVGYSADQAFKEANEQTQEGSMGYWKATKGMKNHYTWLVMHNQHLAEGVEQ